jgi:hypothetical protein
MRRAACAASVGVKVALKLLFFDPDLVANVDDGEFARTDHPVYRAERHSTDARNLFDGQELHWLSRHALQLRSLLGGFRRREAVTERVRRDRAQNAGAHCPRLHDELGTARRQSLAIAEVEKDRLSEFRRLESGPPSSERIERNLPNRDQPELVTLAVTDLDEIHFAIDV